MGFSHDSEFIAAGSEDLKIDIVNSFLILKCNVETGELVNSIKCTSATNSIAWHPSQYVLVYAGDEKDKYGKSDGIVNVFSMDK